MGIEDYKNREVVFKFYLPDNQDELWIHNHANEMHSILYDIDQRCRSVVKYEENASKDRVNLAEEIRELINSKINLYNVK